MYLRATAKINLALDVLRRREDGYHEVRMVMQMVGMYDKLELVILKNEPCVRLTTNLPYIPTDDNNLAVKAARLLMEEKGVTDGLEIRLMKFIPVAAGLAGGSSDAAMTLVGVNRLFHLGFSTRELMERGAKLGADIPYCILRGTALAEGIGERLTSLPRMPECRILLCKPNINVSTKEVYTNLQVDRLLKHPDVDGMIEALRAGDLDGVTDESRMYNVLETVTAEKYPVIRAIEQDMLGSGAIASIMSGSGPTVFGIYRDPESAEAARRMLRAKRPHARTFLTWPSAG